MIRFYQILRWTILLGLFICILVFKPNTQRDSVLYLNDIVINSTDNKILDASNILEYLAIYNYSLDSLNIISSDLQNLEKLLLAHPVIKRAQVYSDKIGRFSISVETKKIIVRVKNDKEDFYIDNNLRDGGKIQILSRIVTKFDIELLEVLNSQIF